MLHVQEQSQFSSFSSLPSSDAFSICRALGKYLRVLLSLIVSVSYSKTLQQKSEKPAVFLTRGRVHMKHIRPPHASMRVRIVSCSLLPSRIFYHERFPCAMSIFIRIQPALLQYHPAHFPLGDNIARSPPTVHPFPALSRKRME